VLRDAAIPQHRLKLEQPMSSQVGGLHERQFAACVERHGQLALHIALVHAL
jgi:hypothetical protein